MALTPRISSQIEAGQSTIINSLTGSLSVARPAPRRTGPKSKESTRRTETVLERRAIGNINEQRVLKFFWTFRLETSDGEGELRDNNLINVLIEEDNDN
jgi:hypothetical protein